MDQCDTSYASGYHHWATTTPSPAPKQFPRQQSPRSSPWPQSDLLELPDHTQTADGSSPYQCMPMSPAQVASPGTSSATPTRSRASRQKMALALAKRPYMRRELPKMPSPPQLERSTSVIAMGEATAEYEILSSGMVVTGSNTVIATTTAPALPEIMRLETPDICPMGEGPFCTCCQLSTPGEAVVRPEDLQYRTVRQNMDSQRAVDSAMSHMGRTSR